MTVETWLDSRSSLKKTLDDIRSRGHYEHCEELRARSWMQGLRYEFQVDNNQNASDETLMRDGPWYEVDRERDSTRKQKFLRDNFADTVLMLRKDARLLKVSSQNNGSGARQAQAMTRAYP